jgi:uncharacterized protein YbjT (DUF2867 family)
MSTLVLGGTGTTGSRTAKHLLAAGAPSVKVATRDPAKASPLMAGAEFVAWDWAAPAGWPSTLAGVSAIYLVLPYAPPPQAGIVAAVIEAAKAAGVKHIVKLTGQLHVAEQYTIGADNKVADDLLKTSGLTYTLVDCNFFMSNHLTFNKDLIMGTGSFYGASDGKPISFISPDDIGAVSAAALLDAAAHHGKTINCSGAAITEDDVAKYLTSHLGKEVTYVNLPPEALAKGMADSGVPPFLVQNLVSLETWKASGGADFGEGSADMISILGRAPQTYPEYLASL